MTLEEKKQYRNTRCAQFLQKERNCVFLTYFRLNRDYTQMPAFEVQQLSKDTGVSFSDLVVKYGFGASVITFAILDHYYSEMGEGYSIGAVAMAQ